MGYLRPLALGEVARGDFLGIFIAQRNEAHRLFGDTDLDMPGRTDVQYPKITGTYATRLLVYWQAQADNVTRSQSVIDRIVKDVFGSQAHFNAWMRKVAFLKSPEMIAVRSRAVGAGQNFLSDADAKLVWSAAENVVLGMKGIQETPSEWTLLKDAAAETLPGLPGLPGLPDLAGAGRVLFYGSIAYGGWWLWKLMKKKGGR